MPLEFLRNLIRAAPKIFVWVTFSSNNAAYVQVTKAAVREYLQSLQAEHITSQFYIELSENGELYLGRPDGPE